MKSPLYDRESLEPLLTSEEPDSLPPSPSSPYSSRLSSSPFSSPRRKSMNRSPSSTSSRREESDADESVLEEDIKEAQAWRQRRLAFLQEKRSFILFNARLATVLLLCGAFTFSIGIASTVLLVGAKASGKLADTTYMTLFIPVWIGNGVLVLSQVISLVVYLPALKVAMYRHSHSEIESLQLELIIPFARALLRWNCCNPLVNLIPPITYLAFLTWFQVWLCLFLDGSLPHLTYFVLAIPLLILEGVALIHLCLIQDTGFLSGSFILCALAFTMLVGFKVDGSLQTTSWWEIFIPVWVWNVCIVLVLVFLVFNVCKTHSNISLSKLQKGALGGYSVSVALEIASAVELCVVLERDADKDALQLFPACSLLAFFSILFLTCTALLVAKDYLDRFVEEGSPVSKLVDAGWTESQPGSEDWGLLGNVAIMRERVESVPLATWRELTGSCTGSNTRPKGHERPETF